MDDLKERLYQIRMLAEEGLDTAVDLSEADIEYVTGLFADIWGLADLQE